VDLVLFAEQRADFFHALAVDRVEELGRAKLFENIFQRQLAEELVFMRAEGFFPRRERQNREIGPQAPQESIDALPELPIAHEQNDLMHPLEVGFLIGVFVSEVAPLAAAAAPPDAPRRLGFLHQEQHFAALGDGPAHELKQ